MLFEDTERKEILRLELEKRTTLEILAQAEKVERFKTKLRDLNYPKLVHLRHSGQYLTASQETDMQQYERSQFLKTKPPLSDDAWLNIIENGIRVLPSITAEENDRQDDLNIFNRRVRVAKNSVDCDKIDNLMRIIFESRLDIEKKINIAPLLKQVVLYCVEMKRRHLLLPVLHRVFQQLQSLNNRDYGVNFEKIAKLVVSNTDGFQMIQPFLDSLFLEGLDIAVLVLLKKVPQDDPIIVCVRETQDLIEKLLIRFLTKIIAPVETDTVDLAMNSLAFESISVINTLLPTTELVDIVSCCKKALVFFNSIITAPGKQPPALVSSFSHFSSEGSDGLSEYSSRNGSMISPIQS